MLMTKQYYWQSLNGTLLPLIALILERNKMTLLAALIPNSVLSRATS